jgi:hypothetical protein
VNNEAQVREHELARGVDVVFIVILFSEFQLMLR